MIEIDKTLVPLRPSVIVGIGSKIKEIEFSETAFYHTDQVFQQWVLDDDKESRLRIKVVIVKLREINSDDELFIQELGLKIISEYRKQSNL